MARNPGTRLGRPPKMNLPQPVRLPSGERQGATPSGGLDTAFPAKAFPKGRMAFHHDDPSFSRGGSAPSKRR